MAREVARHALFHDPSNGGNPYGAAWGRWPVVPSPGEPATAELLWFCRPFGRETGPLAFEEHGEDADLRVEPHETTGDILAFYARARADADEVHADIIRRVLTPRPAPGRRPWPRPLTAPSYWSTTGPAPPV